jgi:uncharacterized delta-60 repeat protein
MKKLLFIILTVLSVQSYSQVTEEWVKTYSSPGNNSEQAGVVQADASGNIYVGGTATNSFFGTTQYYIIKYNSSGTELWNKIYAGTDINNDALTGMVLDAAGNVYVTGYSSGTTHYDYATVKYNSAGVQQWAGRYNGTSNDSDLAMSITVDASGNVYVTGASKTAGNYNCVTVKYNSTGNVVWAQTYNGPGNGIDQGTSVKVDASGNVYVSCISIGSGTEYDYATIKYNSAGVQLWASRYNGPGNQNDIVTSLSIDASGNTYVTGYSRGSGTALDYATIKYNSSGNAQWLQRYNGPAGSNDFAYSIAVDAAGNVYVTGQSDSAASSDYATVKYNSTGVQQWVRRYNGPGNGGDLARFLLLDGSGNIYVTGGSSGIGTNWDMTTIKYDPSGTLQWAARYNGSGNAVDVGYSIALTNTGTLYVTGTTAGTGSGNDYCTIKYSQLTGIQNVNGSIPSKYELGQNYPNPFNPVTNIYISIPKSGFVNMAVYDITGKEVSGLVNEQLSAGSYKIDFDASALTSGTYFYKLTVHGFTETKKMMLVK